MSDVHSMIFLYSCSDVDFKLEPLKDKSKEKFFHSELHEPKLSITDVNLGSR